ncbi:hypothetical protein N2152v2_003643 [Parachlorella kessleri]
MAKSKSKQVSFANDEEAAQPSDNLYRGFRPDGTLKEVSILPKLDCSPEALGEDKELWLIQLPLQFDTSKPVTWAVDRSAGAGGLKAHCSVDGVAYELAADREANSLPLYIVPGSGRTSSGKMQRVARRLTVLRTTKAPQICFGVAEDHQQQLQPTTQPSGGLEGLPQAIQAAVAKKKAKGRELEPAAVAPVISEPRQAVPPSAAEALPRKSDLTSYGGGLETQQQPAAGTTPGAGAGAGGEGAGAEEEREREGKEKKRKKKKKAAEVEPSGAAGAAAAAAADSKADGEGSSKKEKKRKKKDKDSKL